MKNTTLLIMLCVGVSLLITGLGMHLLELKLCRLGCNKQTYIPIKPYVIIDKNGGATDYTIVCVDANGMRFTFDTNFTNEDKYHLGDTIK